MCFSQDDGKVAGGSFDDEVVLKDRTNGRCSRVSLVESHRRNDFGYVYSVPKR